MKLPTHTQMPDGTFIRLRPTMAARLGEALRDVRGAQLDGRCSLFGDMGDIVADLGTLGGDEIDQHRALRLDEGLQFG